MSKPPTLLLAGLMVFVSVMVLAAHWPALSAKALLFDDSQYLTNNHLVQNPSWASASRFLTEVAEPSTVKGYYQPLTMISLMLDCAMGGGPDNLAPFHATSLVLHVVNTTLIFVLLYRLIGNCWAAAIVSLLFGVHPMNVEVITWVGERKTLLATFFALLSLLSYVRYAQTQRRGWYGVAAGTFVLASMSKPTTTPLPLLLLLLDFWPLRRLHFGVNGRRLLMEKLPFFTIAGVSAVITYASQKATAATYSTVSPLRIPLLLCHNIVFYPRKMLWPVHLSSHYPVPTPMDLSQPMVLAGVAGTVVLMPLLWLSRRWTRAFLTGWLFFFLAILPTMGVIGFTTVIASDKYAYLPVVGLLLALTSVLAWVWSDRLNPAHIASRQLIVLAAAMVVSGAEFAATRHYLSHWQDSESLAWYMVKLAPRSAIPHNHLACELGNHGKPKEAIQEYREALHLDPAFSEADYNLASLLWKQGNFAEAAKYYKDALDINPTYAEAHNGLGITLMSLGQVDQAIEHYREAIHLNGSFADAHYNLASAWASQRRFEEATSSYSEALRLEPGFADAHNGLAHALASQGRLDDAISQWMEALRLKSAFPEAHQNLAVALAGRGSVDEAIQHWTEALRLKPNYIEAHYNLAVTLANQGNLDEAARHYRSALEINPSVFAAHKGLAEVLERQGKLPEGIKEYEEALRLNPQDAGLREELNKTIARKTVSRPS